MTKVFLRSWPLFFGLMMIMVGNGLQGTLLGLRASYEGFGQGQTGLIMSMYFIGYLAGCIYIPKFVINVGHIRVFAAMASLASTTVLIHGVVLDPGIWGFVRMFTGFAYAGLFVVIESWLNNESEPETRGRIMAGYMFINLGGTILGQFLLSVGDPEKIELFVIGSIFVSLSLLPIALHNVKVPELQEPSPLSLKRLFILSPLGVFGCFITGIVIGTFYSIAPVFANMEGFSNAQVGLLISVFTIGGACFQILIGWISDYFNRQSIIAAITCAAAVFHFCLFFDPGFEIYMVFAFLAGGCALCIYSLCVTHTNDYLSKSQVVSASSALILVYGIGGCIGPVFFGMVMQLFGSATFFPSLALFYISICFYGLYCRGRRKEIPIEDQGEFMPFSDTATPIASNIIDETEESVTKA